MQERIAIRNESMHRLEFEVALELAADFADIISVKLHDFSLGDPANARSFLLRRSTTTRRQILIVDPAGDLRTRIVLSRAGRVTPEAATFDLSLDSHERWDLTVDVVPSLDADADPEPPSST